MVLPLLVLIGGTLAAWAAVAVFVGEAESVSAAKLAVAITLPPVVLTFLAMVTMSRRWPEAVPTAMMAGTIIRMTVAFGCVAILGDRATEFGTTPTALREWTTGFYLLTLALETCLLYSRLSRPSGGKHESPAA